MSAPQSTMPAKHTVLILDDEEGILELTALYLRDQGHATLQCTSTQAAVERFKQSHGAVDLLIADVTLPDGSGVEAGVRLHELRPGLKLMFMSGYAVEDWNARDASLLKRLPRDSVRILRKPFSSRDLLAKAGELIGTRRKSQPPEPGAEDEGTHRHAVITALERQAELLELAHDAIMVRDLEGRIRYWNRGAEALYGWGRDSAIGSLTHDLLHTVFPVPFHTIEEALRNTGHWEGELRHTVRDGSAVVVSSRWAVRNALDGKVEILEINRDITAEKQVLEGIRRAEQRFRGLLESAPDAMVIVRGNGEITLVNAQTETLFGYSRGELLGKSVEMLVPRPFRGRHPAHRQDYVRQPHVRPMGEGFELFGLRKNGEQFPVEISLSPLETDEGVLISSSIRDISERKGFERALRDKNVQLERADQAKDLFLASMSHELRAPLHTIIGFADLLAEEIKGPLNADQKRYVGHIQGDSQHLMELINDILDLSKIQAGELKLRWEHFPAAEAIQEVVTSLQPQLAAKLIELETAVDETSTLHADHLRFKQILYNLLSNAIKFTPAGGRIHIGAAPAGGLAEISVRDSGIGIAKEDQESIFERFHQSGSTVKAGYQGTGLGLAITKALVQHHGGVLRVESAPGLGSCFTFTMPLGV